MGRNALPCKLLSWVSATREARCPNTIMRWQSCCHAVGPGASGPPCCTPSRWADTPAPIVGPWTGGRHPTRAPVRHYHEPPSPHPRGRFGRPSTFWASARGPARSSSKACRHESPRPPLTPMAPLPRPGPTQSRRMAFSVCTGLHDRPIRDPALRRVERRRTLPSADRHRRPQTHPACGGCSGSQPGRSNPRFAYLTRMVHTAETAESAECCKERGCDDIAACPVLTECKTRPAARACILFSVLQTVGFSVSREDFRRGPVRRSRLQCLVA